MANQVEKLNGIEVTDIEKLNRLTDDNIEKLIGLEFSGGTPYKVVDEDASGGSVETDGDYKIHTFTSTGNFVVTSPGITDNTIQYLMVGGGGLGGGGTT